MTVEELIQKLQDCPPSAVVLTWDYEDGWTEPLLVLGGLASEGVFTGWKKVLDKGEEAVFLE